MHYALSSFHTITFYGNKDMKERMQKIEETIFPHDYVLRKLGKGETSFYGWRYSLSTRLRSTETKGLKGTGRTVSGTFHTITFYGNLYLK